MSNSHNPSNRAALQFENMTDAALAALLDRMRADSAFAERIGASVPMSDPLVRSAVADAPVQLPPSGVWAEMWQTIEAETERDDVVAARPRILRLWAPFAAVAAGIVIMFALNGAASKAAHSGEIRLATSVEIDDLETSDDVTPMIWSTDGVNVIWLIENDG